MNYDNYNYNDVYAASVYRMMRKTSQRESEDVLY